MGGETTIEEEVKLLLGWGVQFPYHIKMGKCLRGQRGEKHKNVQIGTCSKVCKRYSKEKQTGGGVVNRDRPMKKRDCQPSSLEMVGGGRRGASKLKR